MSEQVKIDSVASRITNLSPEKAGAARAASQEKGPRGSRAVAGDTAPKGDRRSAMLSCSTTTLVSQ